VDFSAPPTPLKKLPKIATYLKNISLFIPVLYPLEIKQFLLELLEPTFLYKENTNFNSIRCCFVKCLT
jgi:hypothetical protein